MASSGTPRHSKKLSEGVTIDIDPKDVSIVDDTDVVQVDEVTASEPEVPEFATSPEALVDEETKFEGRATDTVATPQSRFSGLLGGLIGGFIALTGAAGLQWAGLLPSLQSNGDLAALQQQVSVLSEKGAAQAVDPAVLDGLATAQAGLQKNAESLASGLAAVEESQKVIASEISALKAASGAASGDPAAVKGLMDRLTALEALIGKQGSSDLSAQVAELGAKLQTLEQNVGNGSGTSVVAQAIAAAGLKAAIDRGGSFASELETYATVSPASPELAQLKGLAASGVPSKTELITQFSDAATAMIAATQVPDPDAGLLQRLADSAKGMVRSRPVGDVEGDTPEAMIARMEVAVNRGDLDAALTEALKLPEAARTAGADYIGKLTARRDTDALVTKALTSALSAAGAAK
jgi:hypothetical protein